MGKCFINPFYIVVCKYLGIMIDGFFSPPYTVYTRVFVTLFILECDLYTGQTKSELKK